MRSSKLIVGACILIGLAGCCTTTPTDPRYGGLAGGVCGASTGAYDRRITEREAELSHLDALSREMESRIAANEFESTTLEVEVTRVQGRIDEVSQLVDRLVRLEQERTRLGRSNAQLHAITTEIVADLDRAKEQNSELSRQIAEGRNNAEDGMNQTDALRAAIANIEQRVIHALDEPNS